MHDQKNIKKEYVCFWGKSRRNCVMDRPVLQKLWSSHISSLNC